MAVQTGSGGVEPKPQLAGPERTLTPQDIFALQQASDVQISLDGKHVAYVRDAADIMTDSVQQSVWIVDVATEEQVPLVPGFASSPRWSPDDKRIAYIANDAAGKPQIFVRWIGSNANRRISNLPEAPRAISWSPDGRSIAFAMFVPEEGASLGTSLKKPEGAKWADPPKITTAVRYSVDGQGDVRPGHTHIFVMPSTGGSPRQLTFGTFDDGGIPSWTPDGRYILFSSDHDKDRERNPYNTEVFQVELSHAALTQLTHRQGPDQEAAISPDGRLIAYTGYDDHQRDYEPTKLYIMNRDGSNAHVLSATLDRDVSQPRWVADGQGIYVAYDDHGITKVALFSLGGRMTVVAEGLADSDFTVSNKGRVAFLLGAADHPADVAVRSAAGSVSRLTRLNAALFQGKKLGEVQPLAVTSSFDGLAIGAWMVTPPNYDPARRYPTILSIHGGPYGDYGPQWSTTFQLYAAAGYVVLYANPRGSISYGFAFANQINDNFPGHDYDDLMSVVDAAIAKGVSDPTRLFVTGGSAGGTLTAWIVGKNDRFKAAVAEKPQINLISDGLTTDQYLVIKEIFGKMPWEDPEIFWTHSPLSLVGNVNTPTLLMVGEKDRRTPPSEAEQFYAALQLRNVPTALVLVPGASHESLAARPSQLAAEISITLAWFDRYGAGAASSLAGDPPAP